jgi:hypothetical protein
MLKRLLIAAGATLIVAIILVAVYYQKDDASSEGYNVECVQPSQPPSAAASLTCKIYSGQNAEQRKPGPPWWHKLLAWPEGITAWLLLLTLGAVVWQSEETKKSAQAALLNAQAVINAERAWITVTPHIGTLEFFPLREKDAPIPDDLVEVLPIVHQFPAKLVNVGKTPARIEASAIRYVRTPIHPSRWDETPDYGELSAREQYAFPDEIMTITGQLSPIATMTKSQIEDIENEREYLFAFGIIKYSDVYGNLHETRFGYVYETQVSHLIMKDGVIHTIRTGEARFKLGGPPKYNSHD